MILVSSRLVSRKIKATIEGYARNIQLLLFCYVSGLFDWFI